MVADVCSPSIEKSPSTHAHSPPNPTIVALQRIFRGDRFVGMLFGVWSSSFAVLLLVGYGYYLLSTHSCAFVVVDVACACVASSCMPASRR